jgi:hypothetical protein
LPLEPEGRANPSKIMTRQHFFQRVQIYFTCNPISLQGIARRRYMSNSDGVNSVEVQISRIEDYSNVRRQNLSMQ